MTVNQILSTKGNDVYSVVSTISVYDAIKVMGEKNVGAILVIEDGQLKGILSERDYARKIVLKDKASKTTLVQEIMISNVITVNPTDDIDNCMELMISRRIRHLPVVENDKVVGLISIGDVVKCIIEKQKETIQLLDSYINGTQS
ncbi:histidine kinase [Flavobacterium sp. L1I52]|uniref:Histidine kinase n=1 Tax=Flavobacterium pokkalii TaxID=1940408 RepID=A0ABR7UQ15_9FLAO|nr:MULTISPECIES: CBS domain-containing protein [Flavobacterium]KQB38045.1 putative signal-transduction protein containing cAMP-binding and CBS domain-containing protein [Flavobacterium daejeonense]MBD0724308.1 histidine kinase [Flavobacterium pokkalii]